jgi:Tfp pilus assembly protein PilV
MRPRRRPRRRDAGVSLIEALVAIVLFALVMAAVATLAVGSMRHTMANRHGTQAMLLAQETLEQLRGVPYDEIADVDQTVTVGGQDYSVVATVTDDDPGVGMKRIVVRVEWTGPEGARHHEVETIYTNLVG